MIRCLTDDNNFRWPDRDDILEYSLDDVLCTIDPPQPNGNFCRGNPVLSFTTDTIAMIREAYENHE